MSTSADSITSVTIPNPVRSRTRARSFKPSTPSPWKAVGASARLVGSSTQQHCPGLFDPLGSRENLLLVFDRTGTCDDYQSIAADANPVHLDHRVLPPEFAAGELEGLEDRDDVLHPWEQEKALLANQALITDQADDRSLQPTGHVGLQTALCDAVDDELNLVLRRPGIHYNDHEANRPWKRMGTRPLANSGGIRPQNTKGVVQDQ